ECARATREPVCGHAENTGLVLESPCGLGSDGERSPSGGPEVRIQPRGRHEHPEGAVSSAEIRKPARCREGVLVVTPRRWLSRRLKPPPPRPPPPGSR